MSSSDKTRGDEFEAVIRRTIDNLLELHGLPRKRWKAVDLRGFKVLGRKIGEVLKACKMGMCNKPLNKGYAGNEPDEEEGEE